MALEIKLVTLKIQIQIFFLLGMPMYSTLHNLKNTTIDLHNYFLDFSSIKSPKIMTLCNLPHEFDNHPVMLESYNHFINQFETIICIDKHIYDYCKKYSNSFGINNNIHFIPVSINTDKFFFKSLKFGKNSSRFCRKISKYRRLKHNQ